MVISYMGGECFKITQGELTLSFNPPSRESSLKASKFGSDVVLISLDNEDFNGVENASFGDRAPFVIAGPGEYEVKEVSVRGFGSESNYGGSKGINTIYGVSLEGMSLVFLGALGTGDIPTEAKQELDDIDVLFLPIGGDGVLDHAQAYKLAVQLEPKLIIPMHYGDIGGKDSLKLFLKEAGEDVKPVDKLTIKKKDLEGKEGEIVVLGA
jgi:L-ascorbate metabolism protein UlaG (beta-lactamase superfamily)